MSQISSPDFSDFISYQLAMFVFRLSRGGGRAGSRGAGGESSRLKGREVNTLALWRFWDLGDSWELGRGQQADRGRGQVKGERGGHLNFSLDFGI